MAKCMAKKLCRRVTFQCNLCEYKQIFYMRPKLRKVAKTINNPKTINSDDNAKKRKKNGSKKKFAGLDRDVMLNLKATPPTHQTKVPIIKKPVAPAVKVVDKKKKGSKGHQQVAAKMEAGSARSKALSKNSMMQLALLLKNKDNSSSGGSNNRLEMMFK